MIDVPLDILDLGKIMDSGQCFRMLPQEDGQILVISEDRFVRARRKRGGFWSFRCSQRAFDGYWRRYFDLGRDYELWTTGIDPDDAYLQRAARAGQGLRVVQQDPWEALVCFIISQRRSVSSITSCVNTLCRMFGHCVEDRSGPVYLFPDAQRLATLRKSDLAECSLGYRDSYVLDAARRVASGRLALHQLGEATDDELLAELMSVKGVGVKVASCVALYGYHRMGIFPVDVWVQRVLEEYYPLGFPANRYQGYAGYLQLLMFYEARHRQGTQALLEGSEPGPAW